MNSKGHLIVSIVKSVLRIIGCFAIMCTTANIAFLAYMFLLAEALGIVEELVDKR